ncbi:hypothetical protein CF326_g7354, partial [Tilletia indica]
MSGTVISETGASGTSFQRTPLDKESHGAADNNEGPMLYSEALPSRSDASGGDLSSAAISREGAAEALLHISALPQKQRHRHSEGLSRAAMESARNQDQDNIRQAQLRIVNRIALVPELMGIVHKHNPEGVVQTLAEAVDAYMSSTRQTAGFTRFVLHRLRKLAAAAARKGDGDSNDSPEAETDIDSTSDKEEESDFEEVSFKLAEPDVIITAVRFAESVSRAKREPGAQGNPTVPSPKGSDDAEEEEEGEEEEGGGGVQGSDEGDGEEEPPRRNTLPPLPGMTQSGGPVTRISSADIGAPSKHTATTAGQKLDKGKRKANDVALTDDEMSTESEVAVGNGSESEIEDLVESGDKRPTSRKGKRKGTGKTKTKTKALMSTTDKPSLPYSGNIWESRNREFLNPHQRRALEKFTDFADMLPSILEEQEGRKVASAVQALKVFKKSISRVGKVKHPPRGSKVSMDTDEVSDEHTEKNSEAEGEEGPISEGNARSQDSGGVSQKDVGNDPQTTQGARAETSPNTTSHSSAGEHPTAQRLKRGLSDGEGEEGVNLVSPPEKKLRKRSARQVWDSGDEGPNTDKGDREIPSNSRSEDSADRPLSQVAVRHQPQSGSTANPAPELGQPADTDSGQAFLDVLKSGNIPEVWHRPLLIVHDILALGPLDPTRLINHAFTPASKLQTKFSKSILVQVLSEEGIVPSVNRLEKGYETQQATQFQEMLEVMHLFDIERQARVDTLLGINPNAERDHNAAKATVKIKEGGLLSHSVLRLSGRLIGGSAPRALLVDKGVDPAAAAATGINREKHVAAVNQALKNHIASGQRWHHLATILGSVTFLPFLMLSRVINSNSRLRKLPAAEFHALTLLLRGCHPIPEPGSPFTKQEEDLLGAITFGVRGYLPRVFSH